jgi:HEPN domain-containing protein
MPRRVIDIDVEDPTLRHVVKKTHDLTDLLEMCVAVEPGYRRFEEVCSELLGDAVEVRYPGEEEPSVEQARTMIEAADRIDHFTRDVLDLD